jgi:hypothetical protein
MTKAIRDDMIQAGVNIALVNTMKEDGLTDPGPRPIDLGLHDCGNYFNAFSRALNRDLYRPAVFS